MAMSRKHYTELAGMLAGEYAINAPLPDTANATAETHAARAGARDAIENLTGSIADMCKRDNPRFDRTTFYMAALGRDTLRP